MPLIPWNWEELFNTETWKLLLSKRKEAITKHSSFRSISVLKFFWRLGAGLNHLQRYRSCLITKTKAARVVAFIKYFVQVNRKLFQKSSQIIDFFNFQVFMKNSSFNNIYNSAPWVTTYRKRQPTRKLCPNNFSCLGEEQFSLVLASFTFEEIWNLREQSLFVFIDWGMVSEGFYLFFFFFLRGKGITRFP